MAISNGYLTLAEFKAMADPGSVGFSADATDDGVIEDLIEAASRQIDRQTGTTFYGRAETHYFDIPEGRVLDLDDQLISVTTFLNGNETEISSDDYILLQPNKVPYYAIKLRDTSNVYWTSSSAGSYEQVLSIEGSWGYSSSAPDNIKADCFEIAKLYYRRRTGQGQTAAQITAAGVVITPSDVPGDVMRDLMTYKRIR